MNKWDKRFMQLANLVASWSKDPSTACGAVITDPSKRVISLGFNGFPQRTSDDPALYENREEKYRRVIHAERNALLFARQDLRGCTMYVVPMPPCGPCAGMIIQAGITRVVTLKPNPLLEERWGKEINSSEAMFTEAEVTLDYLEDV